MESRDLVDRARNRRLSPDEAAGGSFTVTNLGSHGIDFFTPIINPGETAILGVGRVAERPAVYNGEVCKRSMMYLCLVFDHRLVDGAPAALFLKRLRELLERPYLLLT
jgi:pyruvate dehydrogenase E2 component (dihydrolipoamide acetyltransferase)